MPKKRVFHQIHGNGTVEKTNVGGMFSLVKFDKTPEPFSKYFNANPISVFTEELSDEEKKDD